MATQRFLVKAAPGLPSAQLTFGAATVNFTVSPLFKSITPQPALGAGATNVWQILTPPPGFAEENAWDVCHFLLKQGFGVAGTSPPEFAEPDFEQQWITGRHAELGMTLARSCDHADPQNEDFPRIINDPFWFRNSEHSQFDAAMAAIGGPDVASSVRIAHLDTGYDPEHHTLPTRLRTDLARNFVDDGGPDDAHDRTSGPLNNLGHGTGTLSILAGAGMQGQAPLGGAPFAEIVPVRVANRVVLFSNSAIARAFDYVHGLNASAVNRVDIITMSMGGLASQAWADAVNALYEQSVFIVTAAGNNFGNLPTHNIVYPARFGRVVAACGVMADGKPYADLGLRLMAGNYGPENKMKTALAAATPNAQSDYNIGDQDGELRTIEVHSVRPARRVGPAGNIRSDLVVEITQTFRPSKLPGARFRGGCTLLIDLATAEVRYMVRKKLLSPDRFASQLKFAADFRGELHTNYFAGNAESREPFAQMHGVRG